ncbi:MAG: DUF1919 domain-containing protein [Abditibacteriota bacterium]|nr:DUF1919 domain-containing protein [Abditibacteriota bacterium]
MAGKLIKYIINKTDPLNTREKTNFIWGSFRRSRLKDTDFTIISDNCWGGHVYRYFQIPYQSPTVGLLFYSEDFGRFISDLREYMSMDLSFISPEESVHYEDLQKHPKRMTSPIGVLGGVEIFFIHYKDKEEALAKWNRRRERINWNNIVYKMSDDYCPSLEAMKKFDNLEEERKVLFVRQDYGLNCQHIMSSGYRRTNPPQDIYDFRKGINLINLINGKSFM